MRKTAVITGTGADVGRATALECAQHRRDVALLSRDPARLDSLAAEIGALGCRAPDNLFSPVSGHDTSHGRFDDEARTWSPEMFTDRHKDAVYAGLAAVVLAALGALVSRRKHSRRTRWSQLAH